MSTCNCTALIKHPIDMCKRCKLDYIEWSTGFTFKELECLVRTVTVAERVKKLKEGLKKQKQLRKPKYNSFLKAA